MREGGKTCTRRVALPNAFNGGRYWTTRRKNSISTSVPQTWTVDNGKLRGWRPSRVGLRSPPCDPGKSTSSIMFTSAGPDPGQVVELADLDRRGGEHRLFAAAAGERAGGGVWGSAWRGRLTENSSAYRLPEARTDFVFSMIGERWGFAGAALTLGLTLAFFARGLKIAADTREPFGRLVAVGIVALFGVQTLVNTGMTVGLVVLALAVGGVVPQTAAAARCRAGSAIFLGRVRGLGP